MAQKNGVKQAQKLRSHKLRATETNESTTEIPHDKSPSSLQQSEETKIAASSGLDPKKNAPGAAIGSNSSTTNTPKTIRITRNDPYGTFQPELYRDVMPADENEVVGSPKTQMNVHHWRDARCTDDQQYHGGMQIPSNHTVHPNISMLSSSSASNSCSAALQGQPNNLSQYNLNSAPIDLTEIHAHRELIDRVGPDLCRILCDAFLEAKMNMSDNNNQNNGINDAMLPTSDEILYHEAYYLSRVLYMTTPPFAVAVYQALEDNIRRAFVPNVVDDVIQYTISYYPTSVEQFRLLLHPNAVNALFKEYALAAGFNHNECFLLPTEAQCAQKNTSQTCSRILNSPVGVSVKPQLEGISKRGKQPPGSEPHTPLDTVTDPSAAGTWVNTTATMFTSNGATTPTIHGRTSLVTDASGEIVCEGEGRGATHPRGGRRSIKTHYQNRANLGQHNNFADFNHHTQSMMHQVNMYDAHMLSVIRRDEYHNDIPTQQFGHIAQDEEHPKQLEIFLTAINLTGIFTSLYDAHMWLPVLRSISLGRIHEELMRCVPNRALRQRLIDALHSTIDPRATHKEKQGMWLRAREQGRTVYIRGLQDLTDYIIRSYLNYHHGEVIDMRYMFDPRSSSFLGYGFVMFRNSTSVDSILRRNTYPIGDGYNIQVKCADMLRRS